jgi:hypothetical protein
MYLRYNQKVKKKTGRLNLKKHPALYYEKAKRYFNFCFIESTTELQLNRYPIRNFLKLFPTALFMQFTVFSRGTAC